MKASRIAAVGLVFAAGLWILSGYLIPHESESAAAVRPSEVEAKRFQVGVIDSKIVPYSRNLVLSGRTEADRKGDGDRPRFWRNHPAQGAPRLGREGRR